MKFILAAVALLAAGASAFVPGKALPRAVARATRGGAVNMVWICHHLAPRIQERAWISASTTARALTRQPLTDPLPPSGGDYQRCEF